MKTINFTQSVLEWKSLKWSERESNFQDSVHLKDEQWKQRTQGNRAIYLSTAQRRKRSEGLMEVRGTWQVDLYCGHVRRLWAVLNLEAPQTLPPEAKLHKNPSNY